MSRREEGQVYLVLLTLMLFLISGGALIAKYSGQDEVSSEARSAADAAALAGANIASENLLGQLLGGAPNFELSCDVGRTEANDYAQRNDATLTSYCFDIFTGTARAEVTIDKPVTGRQTTQTASAKLRALPHCEEKEPEPPPDDDENEDEEEEPKEPPKPIITCSLLGLDFELGDDVDLDLDKLKHLLEPRLVANQ